MVMKLFDHWGLERDDRLILLGLSPDNENALRHCEQEEPLPENSDCLDRAAWLLSIHSALRTLYPKNPEICYSWVTRANLDFGNRPPLVVMKQNGMEGIQKVARHLNARLAR